jgi:DNA polymerase-3 subunit gamma/tau
MFRALVREQEDLAWAPEPFAVLEMALVRLATLPSGDEVGELLARLDALERRLAGGGGGEPGPATEGPARGAGGPRGRGPGPTRRAEAAGASAPDATPAAALAAPAPGESRLALEEPEAEVAAPPAAAAPAEVAPEQPAAASGEAPASAPTAGAPELPREAVFDRLRVFAQRENRGLFAALEGGRLTHWDGEQLRLVVTSGIGARRLFERRADLATVCERFFDRPVRVELEIESDGAEEAARGRQASAEEGTARRRAALNHPALNAALEILDAEIVEIRPLGGPA